MQRPHTWRSLVGLDVVTNVSNDLSNQRRLGVDYSPSTAPSSGQNKLAPCARFPPTSIGSFSVKFSIDYVNVGLQSLMFIHSELSALSAASLLRALTYVLLNHISILPVCHGNVFAHDNVVMALCFPVGDPQIRLPSP